MPRYPALFQVNTRVRLSELSDALGRSATLDDVTDAELDGLARDGESGLADAADYLGSLESALDREDNP